VRLYNESIKGFSFLKYLDDGGMKREVLRDSMILVKNTRGSSIAANRIVYATSSEDNIPLVNLAKADSTTTMPAIGVTIESIADGAYGRVMQVGLLEDINTNTFEEGDILFVSDTTAGVPTATAPITPSLTQEIGTVLVKSATAGAIQIISRALTGDEYGTVNNDFYIGDGLATDKTLHFNGATDASLVWDGSILTLDSDLTTGSATTTGSFYITNDLTVDNGTFGMNTTTPKAALVIDTASDGGILVSETLADGDEEVAGYPTLLTLSAINANTFFQLGYKSNTYGDIANWQDANNVLKFSHYDTTDTLTADNILMGFGGFSFIDQTGSGGDLGVYEYDDDIMGIGTISDYATAGNNTPTMVIDNSVAERVGIGTTSPNALFQVSRQSGGVEDLFKVGTSTDDDIFIINRSGAISTVMSAASSSLVMGFNAATGLNGGSIGSTFIGIEAGMNATTSVYNTGIGHQVLKNNIDGSSPTKGQYNTAVGTWAMKANTYGALNTAMGVAALTANTTGINNVAIGSSAGSSNTTGNSNFALGTLALAANTTGSQNTAVGTQTLVASVDGDANTILGYASGGNLTTGNNNIAIGYNVDFPDSTGNNQLTIGNIIYGIGIDGTNATVSTGNIGIATSTPRSRFSVGDPEDATNDYVQIDAKDGAPAAGDCDEDSETGKMIVDYTNDRLYVCNQLSGRGWDYSSLTD
jgi:hypothetical protein